MKWSIGPKARVSSRPHRILWDYRVSRVFEITTSNGMYRYAEVLLVNSSNGIEIDEISQVKLGNTQALYQSIQIKTILSIKIHVYLTTF